MAKKMGRPRKGAGRPYKIDIRLWEVSYKRLEELVKLGQGKVSKADVINFAILGITDAAVQAQVNLIDAEHATDDYEVGE